MGRRQPTHKGLHRQRHTALSLSRVKVSESSLRSDAANKNDSRCCVSPIEPTEARLVPAYTRSVRSHYNRR